MLLRLLFSAIPNRLQGSAQRARLAQAERTRLRGAWSLSVFGAAFTLGLMCMPRLAGAEGDAFSTSSSSWQGYSEFVRLAQRQLGTRSVRLTAKLNYRELTPNDAIVIVRPTRIPDATSLSAFLADGGRVALLDDYGKGNALLQKFKIRRGAAPADPAQRLRNNPALPLAVPARQIVAGAERGQHPMTEGVELVATNHPVSLEHPDLTTVLEIHSRSGEASPLAVTGVIAKKGRLFALGDPSVFINLMMRYPGNRALAKGLISYLGNVQEQPATAAELSNQGRLFILANEFSEEGQYGVEESLLDDLREKLAELQRAVASVDNDGLPNEMALALASLLALWVFASQLRTHLRVPALIGHSFAQPALLTTQTGLGARASILSSRRAHPNLVLAELDAALRETLSRRLGVDPAGTSSNLKVSLMEKGVPTTSAAEVGSVLAELRSYGQALTEKKPRKATEETMKRLHTQTMGLIHEIESLGELS